jgi:hypothetical protein
VSLLLQSGRYQVTPHPWGLREVAFSEVTGERVPSFRDLSLGETAALSLSKGMRRGQNSPGGKSQKRPARSLGAKEKASSLSMASSFNKYQLF